MTAIERSGIVAVVGRPNVGKSTLVNAVVGAPLSIVTAKPQTTRHRLLGVARVGSAELVLVDTPGLHDGGGRAINRYMNRVARGAMHGVDHILFVVEALRFDEADERALAAVIHAGVASTLVINKVDQIPDKSQLLPFIEQLATRHEFARIVPISARRGSGVQALVQALVAELPIGEARYAEDAFTSASERFLVGELIREQLMTQLGDELPWATTVVIDHFDDAPGIARIGATIHVEREGQKGIVIGKGGSRLKSIGTAARLAAEKLLDRRVHLELWCKLRRDWTDDESVLRELGYSDQ